jgi:hypothetical protein
MLRKFITAEREEILNRARKRVCARSTSMGLADRLPLFLNQLGDALLLARAGRMVTRDSISKRAGARGNAAYGDGLSVECAILAYCGLCDAVTELAIELDAPIGVEGFVRLDLWLDDAIAFALG